MKRLTKISFVLLLLFASSSVLSQEPFQKHNFDLKHKTYTLEIAESGAQKSLGLMHRVHLMHDHGMLFRYDRPGHYRIWMKNTRIPLSVLWLDKNAIVKQKKVLKPCKIDPCEVSGRHIYIQFIVELSDTEFDRFEVGDQLDSIKKWADLKIKR